MENPVTSTKINNKGSILMPNYVIFAGVNGAGKSTLYNTITPTLDLGVRINTDEGEAKNNLVTTEDIFEEN